ncbi:MAG: hypothetical protein U1F08_03375 [Steroidobacteraceae bacterium]
MKARNAISTAALIAIAALNAGCVTGQRVITLNVPASPAAQATKGTISIAKVTDNRHFENKPAEASTPSIDGDVNTASPATLSTMIGRQRNGFGKAMGDVALAPPATVESQTQALVTEGLQRRGYTVVTTPNADSADVKIEEFWAWFRPGFAQIAFEAQIRTLISVTIGGQQRTLDVTGHGREEGQMASDEHWQRAYELAFEDYLKNLETSLTSAGL